MEVALSVPFESDEIIEIAVAQFRKRLQGLSPLQNGQEYGAFSIDFNHVVKLYRVGQDEGLPSVTTLAWGGVSEGAVIGDAGVVEVRDDKMMSADPNTERLAHGLPLTVEAPDGKGGKTRRKVKMVDDGR